MVENEKMEDIPEVDVQLDVRHDTAVVAEPSSEDAMPPPSGEVEDTRLAARATTAEENRVYQLLDSRVVRIWQLQSVLVFGILCVVAFLVGSLFWSLSPLPKPVIALIWGLALGLLVLKTFWWPGRYFASWSYALEPKTLELRHGIFWQVSVLIPLSRVQHVDMHRGPLERNRGLASLEIHTAGTRDASHRLPGLDFHIARQLRDQLVTSANLRLS